MRSLHKLKQPWTLVFSLQYFISNRAHRQIDMTRSAFYQCAYFHSRSMGRNNSDKVRLFRIPRALFSRFLFGNVTWCVNIVRNCLVLYACTMPTYDKSWQYWWSTSCRYLYDTCRIIRVKSVYESYFIYQNTDLAKWQRRVFPFFCKSSKMRLYIASRCRKMFISV